MTVFSDSVTMFVQLSISQIHYSSSKSASVLVIHGNCGTNFEAILWTCAIVGSPTELQVSYNYGVEPELQPVHSSDDFS